MNDRDRDAAMMPFRGVRVADFAWVIAGPLATQYLSTHGADVIHIESRGRPDVLRAGPPFVGGPPGPDSATYFATFNNGKRGLTLNLRHPHAVELAKAIVASCDVVAENFTPGTMEKLGLGYEALRAVRPDVIMLSMGLAGQTGPERGYKGFGTVIQGSAGITHLTGWPDRAPAGTGVAYTDFVASHVAAFALLCALEHRRRTGQGSHIDLSQQEASLYTLDAALLDRAANGRDLTRAGNRHPAAAPHGAFPCQGDDAWIALAVMSDREWLALRTAVGDPAWASEERFTTLLGRKEHEDDLERIVSEWSVTLTAPEAYERLRVAGVPVSIVASSKDLDEDEQLRARGHFLALNHPVSGDFGYDALAYRLDGAVPIPPGPSPLLGQHNAEVYQELLGLSPEEYARLEGEGAFQ